MKYLIIILFSLPLIVNSQIAIVANQSVKTDTISIDFLQDIYTLNANKWKNGESIIVVDLKSELKSSKIFYETIDVDIQNLKKIRLKKLYTGKVKPPKSLTTEEELIDLISKTPGAVGYVDKKKLKIFDGIKILTIVDL